MRESLDMFFQLASCVVENRVLDTFTGTRRIEALLWYKSGETLIKAAELKQVENSLLQLRGANDILSIEVKHHKSVLFINSNFWYVIKNMCDASALRNPLKLLAHCQIFHMQFL